MMFRGAQDTDLQEPGMAQGHGPSLLRVENLTKAYPVGNFLDLWRGRARSLAAVRDISFSIAPGEAFALVGESGCGKSTAARAILRLTEPTSGRVLFRDEDVTRASPARMRELRRAMQIVFQDPMSSLNPKRTIGQALAEPLAVHGVARGEEAHRRVQAALDEVGLPSDAAGKHPHQFSGGQRQRIGIARALILGPELLVADEPVSALDVSIQAQVLLLLQDLQRKRRMGMLFISHDLGVVRLLCQRVAVMYLGRIVEIGPVADVFDAPMHPYTRALRDASPVPEPGRTVLPRLTGDVPSPLNPPSGCPFHPRCAKATDLCRVQHPAWTASPDGLRGVACHHPEPAPSMHIQS